MRRFVLVLAVLTAYGGAAFAAGKLDAQLEKAAPGASAANGVRRDNVRGVRHAIRALSERPDVRSVLKNGGEILLGARPGGKTHVKAQVYKTTTAALVLRGPAPGSKTPRLTLRALTTEEGLDGIGFVKTPVKRHAMEDKADLTFAKGASAEDKSAFATAITAMGLTPKAIGDSTLVTP